MFYNYKGISESGAQIAGNLEAGSELEAIELLKKKKILVISIGEASETGFSFLKNTKPTYQDFEFITSELSLLLHNGIKIDKALSILARAKAGTSSGAVIEAILGRLNKGDSISAAFSEYPDFFDFLYINLIKIGEETATLPEVFAGLASNMKFKLALRQKISQALIYPAVILTVCLMSIFFIFNFVVPNMSSIFREQDNLPVYTSLILAISDWLVVYQYYLFAGIAAFVVLCSINWQNSSFKQYRENLFINMPVLKGLFIQTERIKLCSSVVLMLKAGIKIDKAVLLACGNVKSDILKKEIDYSLKQIKLGQPIAESLATSSLFPSLYLSLIEVGEQSGKLESVFEEITVRSRNEFEVKIGKIINIIEPLLILIMGGIVGSVVVTMMLSITTVNDVGL